MPNHRARNKLSTVGCAPKTKLKLNKPKGNKIELETVRWKISHMNTKLGQNNSTAGGVLAL